MSRTNIELDDRLVKACMKRAGEKTKRAVVERALQELLKMADRRELNKYFGKGKWEGNLDEMRAD